jgi:hypothetical protein
MHALARHLARGASVIVCDPDAIDGQYPGYRVVGAGDDYAAIGKALALATKEITKRREQRKTGKRDFAPIWMLVDEAHDVVREIDGAWAVLEDIIRRGRKLNVHCAIGTQDAQVKSLGLEGKSKLLDNLVRVDVRVRDGRRVAIVDGIEHVIPALPTPDDTVQKPVETAETDPLLAALLGTVSGSSKPQTAETSKPVSGGLKLVCETSETTSETDLETAIRKMHGDGLSKNRIAEWLKEQHGIGNKVKALKMINAALDSSEQSDDDDDPPEAFRGLLG